VRLKFSSAQIKKYGSITLIGVVLIFAVELLGFFEGMNNYCYDLYFRLRGPINPDKRIVIVAIDERSLEQLGQWPIPRVHYARLLDHLARAGVVGFNIIMAEPARDDALLDKAIRKQGRVVLPAYIDRPSHITYSLSSLAPRRVGHAHLEQDIDGIVRKIYHTLYTGDQMLPSFSSAVYETLTGQSFPREEPRRINRDRITEAGIIQLDSRNINFIGPPGSIPRISLVDAIDGKYPDDFFNDKIVLVGVTVVGVESGVLTPFSQKRNRMTSTETHAQIIENLLDHNSIIESSRPARWIFSVCFALLGLIYFIKLEVRRTPLLWGLAITAAFIFTFILFVLTHRWYSPVLFAFLLTFMFIVEYIFKLEQAGNRLVEAQQEWEESFNTITDAIVLMDRDGNTLRTNEAAGIMLTQHTQELLRKQGIQLRDQSSIASTGTFDDQAAMAGQPATDEVIDPVTNRQFEIKSHPRLDKKGRFIGVVHIVRDISERKRLEQQLLQAQKMESIGQLAGGVAHDFNNILSAIIGYGSILQRKMTVDDPLRLNVDHMLEAAERAAQLTHSLLAFSRKQVMSLMPVRVSSIIARQEKFLRRIIGEDLDLKIVCRGDAVIMADCGQIEQVLMNLSANARDAMPNGGNLLVETDRQEMTEWFTCAQSVGEPGDYAVISVSDNGTGMDEETRQKLFEPFFTTKEVGKGTGLGLAIVYGIIKQHKGYISVYSEVGKGTTFKIYLPVYRGEENGQAASTVKSPVMSGTETILFAEDDATFRRLFTDVLAEYGYTVVVAEDGDDAIKKFKEHKDRIQICVLDMIMPKKSGRDVYDAVQKVKPGIRVIFLSGYTAETARQRGLPTDSELIAKPATPQVILSKIRKVLDSEKGK
jgi:PAS domain S-box-containing protein